MKTLNLSKRSFIVLVATTILFTLLLSVKLFAINCNIKCRSCGSSDVYHEHNYFEKTIYVSCWSCGDHYTIDE